MRKEFSDISRNKNKNKCDSSHLYFLLPQLSRLQPVDGIVSVHKYVHEWFLIKLVYLTKPLPHQTKEFLVSPEINV